MTHTDIIWIVVTLTFSSTVGVYAAIRYTNLHTRPPVNTLQRSGDIELVDYIEPTRPQQIFNYPDLLESHGRFSYYYDRISDYGRVPSYRTGTPPIYQSVDRLNIICPLEDYINLDYILILILSCFIFLWIRKLIISNKLLISNKLNIIINHIMIILLILFLAIVYIQFGLLPLAQIIIWIITLFLSIFFHSPTYFKN